MDFKEKNIYYSKKGIYEYFNIIINKNNKRVFTRYLNTEVYTIEEAREMRDKFLEDNKEKFEFEKQQRKMLRKMGIKIN